MDTGKININDLKKKYDNFAVPYYTVEINDKPLDAIYCIDGITVELSAKFEAGGCVFDIKNSFHKADAEKIEMTEKLRNLIKLGNKVKVKAGYRNSDATEIFNGYIDSICVDYNKESVALLSVECLDGKGLMMNSLRSESKVSIKKYSEAVENILKKYSSVITVDSNNLDKTDTELTIPIEQHNESDYDFIIRTAKKMNYSFFIDELGSVVFKPINKLPKDVQYEFNINNYMIKFKMNTSLRKQVSAVSVVGGDIKEPSKTFNANISNYKSIVDNSNISTDISKVISPVEKVVADVNITSQQEAEKIAEAMINELSYSVCTGSVKIVGIPEIKVGKIVSVKGFGDGFDKKYFVSKVIHKIKNNIYTTECELEVNEI